MKLHRCMRRQPHFRAVAIVLLFGALVIFSTSESGCLLSDNRPQCSTDPSEYGLSFCIPPSSLWRFFWPLAEVGSLRPLIKQLMYVTYQISESDLVANHTDMRRGVLWKPLECRSLQKVVIIIPVRDRDQHLYKLLYLLIPILKQQKISFRIIIAEQHGNDMFNKGRLLNAAFDYARDNYNPFDCVIFHDVDMLPENDHIPYRCGEWPTHLGAYVNTFNYTILAGGVLALRRSHMETINGYSNEYWGWGGEDDDVGKRIFFKLQNMDRPDPLAVRYTMFVHKKRHSQEPMYITEVLKRSLRRMQYDGLNNKVWTIMQASKLELFDRLLIDVGNMSERWRQAFDEMAATTVRARKRKKLKKTPPPTTQTSKLMTL